MQRVLIWLLRSYKQWLSPLLPSACRFHPTCSVYAQEAIEKHGAGRGSWLAVKRLCRCHPFHSGGIDPVPELHGDNQENRSEGPRGNSPERSRISAMNRPRQAY